LQSDLGMVPWKRLCVFAFAIGVFFVASAAHSVDVATAKRPKFGVLKANPARVKFGKVSATKTKSFVLKNKGGVDVSGSVGPAIPPFSVHAGAGAFTLAPAQSMGVVIEFAPLAKGAFHCVLVVSSDAKKGAHLKVRLSGRAKGPVATPTATTTATPTPTPTLACYQTNNCLRLDSTEDHILDQGQFGIYCMPDEHLTYMDQGDGSTRFWIAGGAIPPGGTTAIPSAIGLTTNDFEHFTPLTLFNGNAVAGLAPSGPGTENFDADYVGPGAVITAANGTDLLMFYAAENHLFGDAHYDFSPFYSSIGLARSTDNGVTWNRVGQVITGITPKPTQPPPGALGATGPSVIMSGGYIYLYYLDVGNYYIYPDVVHVARAPVASDGAPGAWLKYYQGAFTEPGLGGLSTPVQGQVPPGEITKGAFWPDVSYNTCLQTFLMVFQTADGYYYSTSPDLLTWTLQGKVFSYSPDFDPNGVWYGYQTLVSPDQSSERVTSCTGYLYYAKRTNYSAVCHSMYRRAYFFGPPSPEIR
jgi:HYDIN/CFA65/VesB-like, Ig-like domain